MNEAKHPLIKLIFYLKRPKIVIVTGQGYQEAREAIFQVLSKNIKGVKKVKNLSVLDIFQNNVLIFESDLKQIDLKDLIYFLKNSILPVLVITQAGEFHPDKEFFAGDIKDVKEAREIAELLPSHSFLILNYDDETVREIDILTKAHSLNFGVGARADVKATDIVISQRVVDGKIQRGLNFKVNHKGSIVPVWLNNIFGRKQIYASLAAASCGMVMDLNLIDVSRGLKSYNSIKGKMRLIKGVKSSWILDGTDNANPLSMAESLEVLKRIEAPRKIAVIGDILGIGKYTIEAHESIGERVRASAHLLFTIGSRAKFIAKGALEKGMEKEKIFQFDDISEAIKALYEKIQEGDLILIDGSKEIKMGRIVEEIKLVK